MIASIFNKNRNFRVDFSKPLDISLAIKVGGVKAWYVGEPSFEPVVKGKWVGEVSQGASVNFRNLFFNVHGHGTHTECVGHISERSDSVNSYLKQYMFGAKLVTVKPEKVMDDLVITQRAIRELLSEEYFDAIIIRTLPNSDEKITKDYSNTNPVYVQADAIRYVIEKGINHLLIDTPSVDREDDGGELLAHRAFWEYPENTNVFRTITELIYVADSIKDGEYLLNLQVAAFENDAAPSRPILYEIIG